MVLIFSVCVCVFDSIDLLASLSQTDDEETSSSTQSDSPSQPGSAPGSPKVRRRSKHQPEEQEVNGDAARTYTDQQLNDVNRYEQRILP